MLPPGPWQVKVRSDSAAYQQEPLDHWHNRGWEFAVSADMSQRLRREIERLPDDAWHLWKIEHDGVIKEWAEVPYVPTRHYERRDSYPYRYVAVRLRRQQGELFRDGTSVRHFAVVSNRWDMEGQPRQGGYYRAGAPYISQRACGWRISQRQAWSQRCLTETTGNNS